MRAACLSLTGRLLAVSCVLLSMLGCHGSPVAIGDRSPEDLKLLSDWELRNARSTLELSPQQARNVQAELDRRYAERVHSLGNYDSVADMVRAEDSESDSVRTYWGPKYKQRRAGPLGTDLNWCMRAFERKGKRRSWAFQIYVDVSYSGSWRFYKRASFEGGPTVLVTRWDSHVGGTAVTGPILYESFAVPMTFDQMREGRANGIRVRVEGRGRYSNVIEVPAGYVVGFLSVAGEGIDVASG